MRVKLDKNVEQSNIFDNSANLELIEFFKGMDEPHRRSAIVRIMDVTSLSRQTIARWLAQTAPIKPIYKKPINEEFRQQIFAL